MNETILVVDDEESICSSLKAIISDEGHQVIVAQSGEEAIKVVEEEVPQLILLDIWLPGMDGLETLRIIKSKYPGMMVIMMSGHGTIETAVKATKLGAFDFIEKPLSLDKVIIMINNALNILRLEEENIFLKEKVSHQYELTGTSPQITELREMIEIVAPTNAWILIMGESGSGKELVARSLHHLSHRAHKSIVEVNCAAIPEELIESELFGHEKGAFTGATEKKRGKFDLAHEGTIFLDEVADMSLKAQAKILRILQEKKFERVGGNKLIDMDVRVLAATNKDLEKEMEAGRFRQDLYYRLHVIPLYVPPLRERKEDIRPLAEKFLSDAAREEGEEPKILTDDALSVLMEHDWPGNVRELKNIMERLVILTPSREITAPDIPPLHIGQETGKLKNGNVAKGMITDSLKNAKMDFEKQFILKKLEENQGNISKTAEAIGLERSNLHKKLRNMKMDMDIKD
ncbi:MAG TPA: sigma-54-dependent Fis family transcriptional regulator [Deltaproteobacteria bacterium]|nr:sigma-54-dependent Fis family transcriptional regulator [Deltaproteobacteria bacterium]